MTTITFIIISTIATAIFWTYLVQRIKRGEKKIDSIEDIVRTLEAERKDIKYPKTNKNATQGI